MPDPARWRRTREEVEILLSLESIEQVDEG
jgi:hypothetical protein